jgi:quinoprotein glucose dehydrogenase
MTSCRLCIPALIALTYGALNAAETPADREWREYLGGPDRNHFSPLRQIDRSNVGQLEVAWQFHTGDFGEMQCSPIVVKGRLYGATASNQVFCLDAATGRELWRIRHQSGEWTKTIRGVAYWEEGDDERVLFSVASLLYAVNARTGEFIDSFGTSGRVDLKQGLGPEAQHKWVVSSTPGTIYRDLIIVPTRVSEDSGAAPGFVQAFNVRTGQLAWVFRTIPQPGEFGYDTWPEGAHLDPRIGGANSWAGMSLDRKRGIVFVPTGSASPDFWGGFRKGQNLFANCLLALDAKTGKRLWHFQFVHHDIWDRDLPAPPNLVTLKRGGQEIPAVAQVTKSGHVFVFHRLTGEPLFPIDEVPVPQTALEGEHPWPTQPIPRKPEPFARQNITENDINPSAPNRDELRAIVRSARTGPFQPLGLDTTLVFPGFDGGAEWGGAAADANGVLYVNSSEMPWIARLVESPTETDLAALTPGHRSYSLYCSGCHAKDRTGNPGSGFPSLVDIGQRRTHDEIEKLITHGRGMMPGFPTLPPAERTSLIAFLLGQEPRADESAPSAKPLERTPYKLQGYAKFLDSNGNPAVRPPWGTLNAIDLNTGDYKWRKVLGNFAELSEQGMPPTGAENYGGPTITASGVLFIAATKDGKFRAFDAESGELLWQTDLPAPGFATPITYEAAGRQFVVVACGGTKLNTKKGDSYIAFALPEQK